MRCAFLLLLVLPLVGDVQIYFGGRVSIGRATAQQNGVPDTLATFLESECDVKPEFPGGTDAWMKHLVDAAGCERAVLDEACWKRTQVVVRFIVERDGSVSDAHIAKGQCKELEALALCAVGISPRWTPGRRGGWKVRARMQVPIRYELRQP